MRVYAKVTMLTVMVFKVEEAVKHESHYNVLSGKGSVSMYC